jgi:transcription elongation factor GreB
MIFSSNREDELPFSDIDTDLESDLADPGSVEAVNNYITPSGLKKLQQEYHVLFHDERPKLVETVSWAASNGDRSENGDYIYGKRRLREIDKRLRFLGRRMASAVVVNPAEQKNDKVLFGAYVTVKDEEGKKITYNIVGEDEINIEERKISWVSPIAKSLIGSKKGDTVLVHRPTGEAELTVVKIEYLPEEEAKSSNGSSLKVASKSKR